MNNIYITRINNTVQLLMSC